MKEKRKLKIIRTISDYDMVNRYYIDGLSSKEELAEADKIAKEKLVKMNLSFGEKMYAISLLGDCFERMMKSIKIPETLLDLARAEDSFAEALSRGEAEDILEGADSLEEAEEKLEKL